MQRISVVGTTGSGKTTLARYLGERLGIPHVELDALHWEPGWTMATIEAFQERTREATAGEAWVTDGNYSAVRPIVWGRADTVVWLDYPLPVILSRLVRRTARRVWTQEDLWNGNRERISAALSRDSLVVWALKSYRRKRREYPRLLTMPEFSHLTVVHLRLPRETARWLESVPEIRSAVADKRGGIY